MSFCQKHQLKLTILATTAGVFLVKYLLNKLWNNNKKKKCVIIQSANDWYVHEHEILRTFNESTIVGIDCEWVTVGNSRKPVSLLQLANSDGYCVLICLSRIPVWFIPIGLNELLKDQNILKVGVGVNDDASKLFHDYCLETQSVLDLRYLARDLPELEGKPLGLKSLAKELLHYNLNKSFSLRCSNWEAAELTADQIKYAADDAIISAKLFDIIKRRKTGWFNFQSNFIEEVEMYIDIPFKQTSNSVSNSNNARTKFTPQPTEKFRYSKPRQRPMYDNCQLVAPDGEVLCSCDKRKAEWYIYKGLGEAVNEEPFTVKLNFEPSGRPKLDNIFYTMEKVNCCVVCGRTENYHRKLVIPSEYRKFFPNLMKKNLSHDVLLLCVSCHKKSNILDQNVRVKLAEMCDAPLCDAKTGKYRINSQIARVRSAALALAHSGHKIPAERKKELEKVIMDYFEVPTVTEEIIQEAIDVDVNILNECYTPHGLKVYQYFCKNGGLIQFEKMWRQHFLDTMQPKYLPTMWSVEHNHTRLALQIINHEREVDFDVSILGLDPNLIAEAKKIKDENLL